MKNHFSSFKFRKIQKISFKSFNHQMNQFQSIPLNLEWMRSFTQLFPFKSIWKNLSLQISLKLNIFLINSIHELRWYSIIQIFFKVVSMSLSLIEKKIEVLIQIIHSTEIVVSMWWRFHFHYELNHPLDFNKHLNGRFIYSKDQFLKQDPSFFPSVFGLK